MEKIRQAVQVKNEASASSKPGDLPAEPKPKFQQTPARSEDAIAAFIEKRNADRLRINSIAPHRLWTSEDAGSVTYQGRRKMDDGSEVLLFGRGGETLVKPSSSRVVAKATHWRVGQTVEIDPRGRVVNAAQGRGQERD